MVKNDQAPLHIMLEDNWHIGIVEKNSGQRWEFEGLLRRKCRYYANQYKMKENSKVLSSRLAVKGKEQSPTVWEYREVK